MTADDSMATKRTDGSEDLAIRGGVPVRSTPLPVALGGACIGEEEKRAVLEVLESRSLFRYYGPNSLGKTSTLELELATAVRRPHCLAVSSGTAALRCALRALEIGDGDEVLVPVCSFLACATAVLTVGAVPVFVDCDETLLVDLVDLEAKVSTRTRVILVVHTMGAAADMDRILEVARRRRLLVIEDCAQALGTTFRGTPTGSFGDVSTFSFQSLKITSSGEGGALATSDNSLYQRAVYYHDLGFVRPERTGKPVFGENLRMSELTAAVALEQLRKLPRFLDRTRSAHRRLQAAIGPIDGIDLRRVPDPAGAAGTNLVLDLTNSERARFFRRALRAENVPCDGAHARLCTHHPVISESDLPGCPRSEALLRRFVSIPLSPALSDADVADVERAISKVARYLPN